MLIKKTFRITLFILLCPIVLFSQEKVLEKSAKKAPDWINASLENYIIAYETGKDIDDVKAKLLVKIKREIVNSVASYVRSSSEISIENVNQGNVVNTVEKFSHATTIQTADIPFLKGISLSKAEDYYWLKTMNKNTKEISFTYHVKYPFDNSELYRLIMDFNKYDQNMTQKMEDIVASAESTNSIEDLDKSKKQLQDLSDYFIDNRKEQAQLEITKIEQMIKQVDINLVSNEPGKLEYNLSVGDKVFTSNQKPKFNNSPCVKVVSRNVSGKNQVIDYNYENCFEDEENYITITYKFGNVKSSKKYAINITSDKVEIFVKDPIYLYKKDEVSDGNITFECSVPVISKYPGEFKIDKIELDFPGKKMVMVKGSGKSFSGKGIHNVSIISNDAISQSDYSAPNGTDINGTIYYTDVKNGEQKRYKVLYHNLVTDW